MHLTVIAALLFFEIRELAAFRREGSGCKCQVGGPNLYGAEFGRDFGGRGGERRNLENERKHQGSLSR